MCLLMTTSAGLIAIPTLWSALGMQPVGGAWPFARPPRVGNHIKSNGFMGGVPGLVSSNTTGTAKLVKVSSDGSDDWQDIEIGVKSSMQQEGKSTTVQFQWNVRVPGDGSTGPVKKTCKAKVRHHLTAVPKIGLEHGALRKTKRITRRDDYPGDQVRAAPRSILAAGPSNGQAAGAARRVQGGMGRRQSGFERRRQVFVQDGLSRSPGADYLLLVSFRYENAASKAISPRPLLAPS